MIKITNQEEMDVLLDNIPLTNKYIVIEVPSLNITKPFSLGNNLTIKGNGVALNLGDNFVNISGSGEINNVKLENMTLISNGKSIEADKVNGLFLSNIKVIKNREELGEVIIQNSKGVRIFNMTFSKNTSLKVKTSESVVTKDCKFSDNEGTGILYEEVKNSVILSSVLNNTVDIKQGEGNTVVGNSLKTTTGISIGISLDSTTSNSVVGNVFEGFSTGVEVKNNSSLTSVTSNTFNNCGIPVNVNGSKGTTIVSNIIGNSSDVGVNLTSSSSKNLLFSNILQNNENGDFRNAGTDNQLETQYNHFLGKQN